MVPFAFILFINDLDDCTNGISIMKLFADNTKLGHRVLTKEDRIVIQSCLNSTVDWAPTSCMEFNVAKCFLTIIYLVFFKIL